MEMRVEVRQTGTTPRPPAGTPVILEIRDVSLQDAPAVVLSSTEVAVTEAGGASPGATPTAAPPEASAAGATPPEATSAAGATPAGATPAGATPAATSADDAVAPTPDLLATATLTVPDEALAGGRDVVVWVRVAASGQARTAVGDLITMQHCPVRPDAAATPLEVPVTRIG
ncbi:MAG: hypothetical protein LPK38_06280 [Actinomycetes bacterium]|nr:hypothetical protein [Actinomycetes bacterium]MDX5380893.1 hypothetical protein [Actinomycetes bacterium]MDX5399983.1 hypothetical protein [Actinomycetes bacterium]MDX5450644.1 hypothetical protein [Actinomycetes bacterium]